MKPEAEGEDAAAAAEATARRRISTVAAAFAPSSHASALFAAAAPINAKLSFAPELEFREASEPV
jgi:hypothetical protein